MTDNIIRMAQEAGAMTGTGSIQFRLDGSLDRFAVILEAKVRKECAELCRAEANGRSPLAFDALHECADLILEGYEE
ncbi:MAG: hypothetical protein INF44_04255 [Thalassospira sp.]|nr:hypothetical protein [Thalassospira sp.]